MFIVKVTCGVVLSLALLLGSVTLRALLELLVPQLDEAFKFFQLFLFQLLQSSLLLFLLS